MLVYLAMIDDPRDHSKFEEIYLTHRDFMLGVANAVLHNEHDAEDAVHNAFLSVATNLSKITDIDSPRTRGFLAVITERKAINVYNKRKKNSAGELYEDVVGDYIDPVGDHDIRWAIAKLPPRYREFILLKYFHGFTTKECAEILDINPATASKLDQRAKQRLMEICREEGIL